VQIVGYINTKLLLDFATTVMACCKNTDKI